MLRKRETMLTITPLHARFFWQRMPSMPLRGDSAASRAASVAGEREALDMLRGALLPR